MIPFSVLDLSPIVEGGDASAALRNTLDLAQHCERFGFHRFWVAEHHGAPGIASAATSVVIAYVAGGTKSIRVGAGGIMLMNHSPLVIAEQFGTLEALYPGRIDLGLGRTSGTDSATAAALGRSTEPDQRKFPSDVLRVQDYMSDSPRQRVIAVPGRGMKVPMWILGSSLTGAKLAAHLGLRFAFASQFAPQLLLPAVALYRDEFKPSAQLAEPYVMVGCNVFAADTEDEAELMATSLEQSFIRRHAGKASGLPPPFKNYRATLMANEQAMLDTVMACTAIGTSDMVAAKLRAFVDSVQPDELIVASQAFDHAARVRSYALLSDIRDKLSR